MCIGQHMATNVRTSCPTDLSELWPPHPHAFKTPKPIPIAFPWIPCGVANQTQHSTHTQTHTLSLSKITIRRICTHFRYTMPNAPFSWEVTTFPVSISRRVPSGLHFSSRNVRSAQATPPPNSLGSITIFILGGQVTPFLARSQCATCRSCCLSALHPNLSISPCLFVVLAIGIESAAVAKCQNTEKYTQHVAK